MGSVVDHSSQVHFFPTNLGSVVQRSSQGRFFCFRILAPKSHIFPKSKISGPDLLKNADIWSDFVISVPVESEEDCRQVLMHSLMNKHAC